MARASGGTTATPLTILRTTSSSSLSLSLSLVSLRRQLISTIFSFLSFLCILHPLLSLALFLPQQSVLIDLGLEFSGGSVRVLLPFSPLSRPFDNVRRLTLSTLDILGLRLGDIFGFYTGRIRFGPSFCRIPRIVTQFPYSTRLSRIRPLYLSPALFVVRTLFPSVLHRV